MSIFKWAKQKLSSAFAKREYKAPQRVQHPAKAQAAAAVRRRLRSPTMALRRRWKWAHVSKWFDKEQDRWFAKTLVLGRNAFKRKRAGGLPPKTARRLCICENHAKLALKAKFQQAMAV